METMESVDPSILRAGCGSRAVLDMIADKWTVLVLCALEGGPRRFTRLQREIGGISQKVLTHTLREMERNGLVRRTVYPVVPPRVEYALTGLGQSLSGAVDALRRWAEGHLAEVQAAQARFDRAGA